MQQCPAFGRTMAWHAAHSLKKRHASTGITISSANPQCGHVTKDCSKVVVIRSPGVGVESTMAADTPTSPPARRTRDERPRGQSLLIAAATRFRACSCSR